VTIDPRYPTPLPGWTPAPPYEWISTEVHWRFWLGRVETGLGWFVPFYVAWFLWFSPFSRIAPGTQILGFLVLLVASQVLTWIAVHLYETRYPMPVRRLGVSPLGVAIGQYAGTLEVPWSHALLNGERLVVVPSRSGLNRAYRLSDAQARRAWNLRPTLA
jgi:hypothetical protein